MQALGYGAPNLRFVEGQIEDLQAAGIEDASIDLVISNCVVRNLHRCHLLVLLFCRCCHLLLPLLPQLLLLPPAAATCRRCCCPCPCCRRCPGSAAAPPPAMFCPAVSAPSAYLPQRSATDQVAWLSHVLMPRLTATSPALNPSFQINLSPDKAAVLREVHRVLAEGGEM